METLHWKNAIATLFKEGIIRRHLKKALKIYKQRRDLFCELLQKELGDFVQFKISEGGLAAWVHFDQSIPLDQLRTIAMKQGVLISRTVFKDSKGENLNAIRMGFASLDENEIEEAIALLKSAVLKVIP